MRKFLPLILLLLPACGGGGGSSQVTYQISGKFSASNVKGLEVCIAQTENCVTTQDDGSFSLSSTTPTPTLEFFLKGENSRLKLGSYRISENGETITPFKLSDEPAVGDALARIIHALNNDPSSESTNIDLSKVNVEELTVDGSPVALEEAPSLKELLENDKNFTLKFSYDSQEYELSYDSSKGELSLSDGSNNRIVTYKKWLVLIYINGDNNLEDAIKYDFNELNSVTYPPQVKVVTLIDYLTSHEGAIYATSELTGKLELVRETPEPDMGDPETLKNFVEEFYHKFPAQKVALILWNHGDGWRSTQSSRAASSDEWNGDILYMYELKGALEDLQENGVKIDLIGFDECLMGGLEVLVDIKDYAEAFVVSEKTEPGWGWDYELVMKKLLENLDTDAYGFGKMIVDAYREAYGNYIDSNTLAVFKKEEVETLLSAVNELANALDGNNYSLFQEARSEALDLEIDVYPMPDYVDLYSLAEKLSEKGLSLPALDTIKTTIANAYSALINTNLKGLYIYFPETENNYSTCYSYQSPAPCSPYGGETVNDYYNPFAAVSSWDEMLETYFSLVGSN
ncbi:clostripain-related cysteine peptidase [Phorcysia thermohydrogeniphila]|uniref:Cysteine peptidase C11 family protein n=1 Tax=Phorcysia thermohydrogeniphila TaxID=936138 RepID=A0A4R1GEB5_9BACT|nr:clostripain-related cysteine peptidase [Phorcysia thermohydrogeniphila]TCK06278.1 cysteine peptidase C11 family protein [Phorcysia thermohydrogeniphila]